MRWLARMFPLPGRDEFARRLVRRFREAGWTGEIEYDAEGFELRFGSGGDQAVCLHNVYADCQRALPWRRRAVQERFVHALRPSVEEVSWQEARQQIVAAVRDPFLFEVVRLQAAARGKEEEVADLVATQELTERLCVCLLREVGDALHAVSHRDLARWEMTFEEALRQGLYNLAAITEPWWTSPFPGVYVSAWNDDHDCSRLLLDKVFRGLEVRGDIVALVPDRNRLIVTGSGDPAALAKALELAAAECPRPVSAMPLLRRWPGWEPLTLPEDHPCHVSWRRVCLQECAEIYLQQKELLEKVHGTADDDLFVASYQIYEDTQTGLRTSYCVWGVGIRSLLPKADRIFFVELGSSEGQTVEEFAWDEVEACCGELLRPTQDQPRRYLVEGPPAGEQLARLRERAA